ncbi:MAG TPA: DUF6226 family protein [Gemmatimonadaceae bacterium]|nr:DUF6226 family protein [Gemmatimonadaceae bacterium]
MHLKGRRVETQLPDEYTRVTNPERFRPLHDFARNFFERLANEYDVIESSEFELVPIIMQRFDYARPPITLTPQAREEAPISVAFTPFPSLVLRCGKFFSEPFPVCACDGCGRNADEEVDRLQRVLNPVIAGEFLEQVQLPLFGNAHVTYRLGRIDAPHGLASGGSQVARSEARKLRRAGFERIQWAPWSKRT